MNVYPLIYSRTKFCDYVSGFLVRPSDLNYSVATRYISVALDEIKHSGGLRHAVFAVGDYLIYGGTACITSALIRYILKERCIDNIDYNYKDFGSDQAGRPITFFIGFAVRKSNIESTTLIPNIDLYESYKIYLKYLEKQWLSSTAKTQTLNGDEAIKLNVREYSAKFIPEAINSRGISILKNYNEDLYRDIINYYYHELVIHPNIDNSFISNILPEMLTNNFVFKNISLYGISAEEYIKSSGDGKIKSTGVINSAETNNTSKVYSSSSQYAGGMSQSGKIPSQPVKTNDTPTVYHSAEQYRQDQEDQERKKMFPTGGKVIFAIAIALLVGIILLVAHRVAAKEKLQVQPQGKSNVQEQQDESLMTNMKAEAIQIIRDVNRQ